MSFYRKARLKSMKDKMMRFLQGRYGVDALSKCLLGVGLVAVILAAFLGGKAAGNILYIFGWVAIIYCYFRIFSKNITKRYAENQKYLAKTYKLRSFFYKQKELMKQRKVYHIYKCPGCSQKIRIPRGKGKIEIRCPKCGTKFMKKS